MSVAKSTPQFPEPENFYNPFEHTMKLLQDKVDQLYAEYHAKGRLIGAAVVSTSELHCI